MTEYISKSVLVAEIERWIELITNEKNQEGVSLIDKLSLGGRIAELQEVKVFIDTLEVKDPYEQLIQYASIEAGIKAHAEEYSFNIESELFNQLTKEQQKLWRKEIEEAAISGGYNGLSLAKDPRYKENSKVKEVNLEKEIKKVQCKYKTIEEYEGYPCTMYANDIEWIAKHFFKLGAQKL